MRLAPSPPCISSIATDISAAVCTSAMLMLKLSSLGVTYAVQRHIVAQDPF